MGLVSQAVASHAPRPPVLTLTVIRRVQSCAQASDSRDFSTAMVSSPFVSSRACGTFTEEGWGELYPRPLQPNLRPTQLQEGQGAVEQDKGTGAPASLCWGPPLSGPHVGASVHRVPSPPPPPPTLAGEDTAALATPPAAEDRTPRRGPLRTQRPHVNTSDLSWGRLGTGSSYSPCRARSPE